MIHILMSGLEFITEKERYGRGGTKMIGFSLSFLSPSHHFSLAFLYHLFDFFPIVTTPLSLSPNLGFISCLGVRPLLSLFRTPCVVVRWIKIAGSHPRRMTAICCMDICVHEHSVANIVLCDIIITHTYKSGGGGTLGD